MGNEVAAILIESFRKSKQDTTLVSNTSANPPSFILPEDIPGVAKAWVNFDGQVPINEQCIIYNSSTNVNTVSCSGIGEYNVVFKPNTFTNNNYIVTGSVTSNSRVPISGANTFFIKTTGHGTGSVRPTNNSFRIQTLYVPIVSAAGNVPGPANAHRVHLLIYK